MIRFTQGFKGFVENVCSAAESLIVIGALLTPAVVLVEFGSGQRSKSHLVCPHGGRQVQTSMTTSLTANLIWQSAGSDANAARHFMISNWENACTMEQGT